MKVAATSVFALLAHAASARFVEEHEPNALYLNPEVEAAEKYHIELSPGETRWVTEEEKWELRRVRPSRLCQRQCRRRCSVK